MNSEPDEIVRLQQEYIKARLKAERTRDPKTVAKIKKFQKLLDKAENDADKTMDPILKKRSEELLVKLKKIQVDTRA
ncbi:MAG: hypothetical protein KGL95_04460 [Patescibacteria group bacterium]|nr:hypothetical protein [Patescibacteria group bacterium]